MTLSEFARIFLFVLSIGIVSCKKDYSHLDSQILAHAGYSLNANESKYPPNTLDLIDYTLTNSEVHGIEIDVQMTADSMLVMYHDLMLNENSNYEGCINSLRFQDLQEIKIYNSNYSIEKLQPAFQFILAQNKIVFLDVKHYNACESTYIDFSAFDLVFDNLISDLSLVEKKNIVLNSRSHEFLNAITDTVVLKSLESDNPEFAFSKLKNSSIKCLTMKLGAINNVINDSIKKYNYQLALYNVKSSNDNRKALHFSPDFVISDNIYKSLEYINE